MTGAKGSDSSKKSESMGRSDDEDSFEMKAPPPVDRADKNSFLDEDFLSFEAHTAENKGDLNSGNSGDRIGRSNSPVPRVDSRGRASKENISIPWLDSKRTSQLQRQEPYQQSNSGRGYGNTSFNSSYYEPLALIKLHNEIVSFVKLMEPTKDELEVRNKMVVKVTDLAYRVFGKERCQVLPFGSQVTGLCLPDSDIDFVIRFPNKDSTKGNAKSIKEVIHLDDSEEEDQDLITSNPLHKFAEAVREEFGVRNESDEAESNTKTANDGDKEEHLSYLEVIEQTRVPLVKFTVEPYHIDIDVCFDQPGGPESADLVHRFMHSMPPLRPLTFVLKYFLSCRDLNKPFTGGIGSYLLQLMIVSFLQHRSREDLMRTGKVGNYFNLGSLLIDFFELYGIDFNYVTTGISVRNDGFYFAKGERDKKNVFWQPGRQFSLAVENPLETTMDVGAGAYRIQMIQRVFQHSLKTLLAYVAEPREQTDSILARIIPPTEAMEQRRVKKVDSEDKAVVSAASDNSISGRNRQDRNFPKKRTGNGHDSNNRQAKHKERRSK